MIEKQIEKVLAAIADLVNNDDMAWKEKKDLIIKEVYGKNDGNEAALDEFLAWFSDDEE